MVFLVTLALFIRIFCGINGWGFLRLIKMVLAVYLYELLFLLWQKATPRSSLRI